ncbi:hypothetical protein QUA08_31080, partial [Microcoleus sp. T3B2]|uniref:hypothetical protein n=1 Tax=Microcoleus sp. T3B2 TaxID=3055426 RepID=UPI002FD38177
PKRTGGTPIPQTCGSYLILIPISNPVASDLILPTVRRRRRAVSLQLIGRWLYLLYSYQQQAFRPVPQRVNRELL